MDSQLLFQKFDRKDTATLMHKKAHPFRWALNIVSRRPILLDPPLL